jgi:hypothetical protein
MAPSSILSSMAYTAKHRTAAVHYSLPVDGAFSVGSVPCHVAYEVGKGATLQAHNHTRCAHTHKSVVARSHRGTLRVETQSKLPLLCGWVDWVG